MYERARSGARAQAPRQAVVEALAVAVRSRPRDQRASRPWVSVGAPPAVTRVAGTAWAWVQPLTHALAVVPAHRGIGPVRHSRPPSSARSCAVLSVYAAHDGRKLPQGSKESGRAAMAQPSVVAHCWEPLVLPSNWVAAPLCVRVKRSRESGGDVEARGPNRARLGDVVHAPPSPSGVDLCRWAAVTPCAKLALRGASVFSCACGSRVLGLDAFVKHAAAAHGLPRYIAQKLAPHAAASSRCCPDCDAMNSR